MSSSYVWLLSACAADGGRAEEHVLAPRSYDASVAAPAAKALNEIGATAVKLVVQCLLGHFLILLGDRGADPLTPQK